MTDVQVDNGVNEVVDFIETYADRISAPVESRTTVTRVQSAEPGYRVDTDRGRWRCSSPKRSIDRGGR